MLCLGWSIFTGTGGFGGDAVEQDSAWKMASGGTDNIANKQRRLSDYDLIGNVLNVPTINTAGSGRRQSVTRQRLATDGSTEAGEELYSSSKRGSLESELSLGSWMNGKRR